MKAVIFDMDGILIDSENLVAQCWMEIAVEKHIEGIGETIRRCTGLNKNDTRQLVLDTYGPEFPYDELAARASGRFQELVAEKGLPVKKGAREVLQFLRDRQVPIGLASSTREAMVQKEMTDLGLIGFFEQIVGGDAVEHSKPNPEIYLIACGKMGFAPADCMAVEDSPNGIRAASAAGMETVMVPDLVAPDEEMMRTADHIFPDLIAFMEYLDKNEGWEA
ncbi:MAG: HAD family hydrolase [Lachnospiraceae bacterium]